MRQNFNKYNDASENELFYLKIKKESHKIMQNLFDESCEKTDKYDASENALLNMLISFMQVLKRKSGKK